jgi:hypothetical protein
LLQIIRVKSSPVAEYPARKASQAADGQGWLRLNP